ncbi:MAG: ComEA family DNA-binding protein [Candidatus Aminicenantales bacterium]
MKIKSIKGLVFSFLLLFFFTSLFVLDVPAQSTGKKININTASATELQKLPRVGEKIARRIIEFRKENGQFKKVEEIMKVKGIGEKTFKKIKDFITVKTVKKVK